MKQRNIYIKFTDKLIIRKASRLKDTLLHQTECTSDRVDRKCCVFLYLCYFPTRMLFFSLNKQDR